MTASVARVLIAPPPVRRARAAIARSYGARRTPRSVTIAVTSAAGVTSNAGLRAAAPSGAMRRAGERQHFVRVALLDRDARRPIGVARIDRADGRDDVERHAVRVRREREAVGADLVRDVAVGGDAVGADDARPPRAPRAIRPAAALSTMISCGMPSRGQLPRRQARALQQRPRLVDEDADAPCPVGARS